RSRCWDRCSHWRKKMLQEKLFCPMVCGRNGLVENLMRLAKSFRLMVPDSRSSASCRVNLSFPMLQCVYGFRITSDPYSPQTDAAPTRSYSALLRACALE